MICFNPRARVGRDTLDAAPYSTRAFVSIHAPAWGATRISEFKSCLYLCFNPRARVGRDVATRRSPAGLPFRFNPRARVGRD